MHNTIRSLTLIALLCTTAPAQAQPSGTQLAAKGLVKIGVGTLCAYYAAGLAAICASNLPVALETRWGYLYRISIASGSGSAGLGTASYYLIRSGWNDLNITPGSSNKENPDEEDDNYEDED